MTLHPEFRHPRLAGLYDALCPWGPDDDLFLSLVREAGGARVLDLGCGTGRLTLALAAAGHVVTGLDPAAASLDVARAKPGADRVTWVEGTSADLPARAYDACVMTSHVAQFLVSDAEWAAALADLRRALMPGALLAFDSRDPADRRWERWNPTGSRRTLTLHDGTSVTVWTRVDEVADGRVTFTHHYEFPDDVLTATATMRFRSEAEIRTSLAAAGFAVEHVYGGWRREPPGTAPEGELVVVARRAP